MIFFFWIILIVISLSMLGILYRLIKGPSIPDRVVALDAIGVLLICLIAILSILIKTSYFLDIILLLAILAFIGTIAFSKFLEKGVIFQRDRSDQ